MAAVLKKRALAEYSQTQTTVADGDESCGRQSPPAKRLRLRAVEQKTSSGPAEGYVQILQRARSSREALHAITSLSELGSAVVDEVAGVFDVLLSLYDSQSDSTVRCCLMRLLAQLVDSCGATAAPAELVGAAEQLLQLLGQERSQAALAQCVRVAGRLGAALSSVEPQLVARLIDACRRLVARPVLAHSVHVHCLRLLGELAVAGGGEAGAADQTAVVTLVAEAVGGQDSRVRAAALESLLAMRRRGVALPVARLYPAVATAARHDDFQAVREAALHVLHALALGDPQQQQQRGDGGGDQRLVDDVFAVICEAITDPLVRVRVCAARLLGSLRAVSQPLLLQTLDKRLMSNMRRKRTGHERQRLLALSGEWAGGRRWGSDAPQQQLHADAVSMVTAGACGAFVHGLEDEFLEVRSAALRSLTALARDRPDFARQCVDYVVDMFNDEIDAVRVLAVNSLRHLTGHIELRRDQLDEVLAVLVVRADDTRHALHRVLGRLQLADTDSLRTCVQQLLASLRRYPASDRASVWRCCQQLGVGNAGLVEALVPELLSLHPALRQPERQLHQPDYTCLLLLVLNAGQRRRQLLALLPPAVLRHCQYVRDTLPHLVAPAAASATDCDAVATRCEPSSATTTTAGGGSGATSAGLAFVAACVQRAERARATDWLQRRVAADLRRLADIDCETGAAALLVADLIEARLLLGVMVNPTSTTASATASATSTSATATATTSSAAAGPADSLVSAVETALRRLRFQYAGVSSAWLACIQQLWLRLLCLQQLAHRSRSPATATSGGGPVPEQLLLQSHHVLQLLAPAGDPVAELLTGGAADWAAVAADLTSWPLERLDVPLPGDVTTLSGGTGGGGGVVRRRALLLEPVGATAAAAGVSDSSVAPLCFTAGLVAAVPVRAELWHLTAGQAASWVRGVVEYPDGSRHVVRLPAGHYVDDDPTDGATLCHLSTTLLVSHQTWSEEAHVLVSLVLDTTGDSGGAGAGAGAGAGTETLLPLCDPVALCVRPRPVRRAASV